MRKFGLAMIAVLLLAAVVCLASLQPFSGAKADPGPEVVEAGYDLLETDSANTWQNVSLPPDFFGPGSDPFDGVVYYKGVPLGSYQSPSGVLFTDLGPTDTIVERRQDAGEVFPDTIEIEIVEMSLVSTEPITVTYNGGQNPEQWDVYAAVPENDVNQTPGDMTIRHEHAAGGTFDSHLPIDPQMTFMRIPGGFTIGSFYYSDITGFDIDYYNSGTPWCHTANPLDTPAGNWVIEKEGLTTNFFGGIDCSAAVGDDLVRDKDYFLRDGLVSAHSVQPAELPETNYKCYDIIPPEPLALPVTLETQFGTEVVDVGPAAYLCPPALKNGMGDPQAPHLKCYDILGAADPDVVVDLETQFGLEKDVAVGQGRLLCMPAVKTPLSPPGQPSGPLVSSPHYECFEITGDAPGLPVTLETQFGFEEVTVGVATYLCAPAIKNGEGDLNAPHLKCYDIYDPSSLPVGWLVQLETQFPPAEVVTVNQAQLLCVPATKTIVPVATPTPTPSPTPVVTPTPTPPPPTPTPVPGDCPDPSSVPWPVPAGDADCDGYSTTDEGTIGTDPLDPCANTSASNDEADDRWPSDFDDNQVINILDVGEVLPPHFGTSVPPTSPRRDLVVDGFINILDVGMALPPFFGSVCGP